MASLQESFYPFAKKIAACANIALCRQSCFAITTPRPSPDFVGKNYRGLLIIGANPGIANNQSHNANDKIMFSLQENLANNDTDAYNDLISHLPQSMIHWKQIVSSKHKNYLGFDVDEIAYIDLVKCATKSIGNSQSDVIANFRKIANGLDIPSLCWNLHTKEIINFLKPTHIIFLWKPIEKNLRKLGYDFKGVVDYASYNGSRHLKMEAKLDDVKLLIQKYRAYYSKNSV